MDVLTSEESKELMDERQIKEEVRLHLHVTYREISQTVRIYCHSFFSRVRISDRPSHFFIGKNVQKLSRKPSRRSSVQLSEPATCRNGDNMNGGNCGHS